MVGGFGAYKPNYSVFKPNRTFFGIYQQHARLVCSHIGILAHLHVAKMWTMTSTP